MRFILYVDNVGFWRWRLVAGDNRTIANCVEVYCNKSDAVQAIDLVKAAYNAPVQQQQDQALSGVIAAGTKLG